MGTLENTGSAFYGGIPESEFGTDTFLSGPGAGRTAITNAIPRRLRQDGYVNSVKLNIRTAGGTIKIKTFRPNGANYDYLGESEIISITSTGLQTHVLSTPVPCQPGDIIGIFLISVTIEVVAILDGVASLRYVTGDITGTDSFASSFDDYTMDIEANGDAPFLVGTGDSIMEGHSNRGPGSVIGWDSFYTGGPFGDLTSEILHTTKGLIDADGILFDNYQEHADGSKTYAWVDSTGIVSALAANPKMILIHCGANDLGTGRTWAQIETNLDSIRSKVPSTIKLFLEEILPWTGSSDIQAATLRTWNANLLVWCLANNAIFVECHDAMGVIRPSTGELDDLNPEYDVGDWVHLNAAGIAKMASIEKYNIYAIFHAFPGPVIYNILNSQWNKVATNVVTGFIHLMDTKTRVYVQTYRLTGEAAPLAVDRPEGVKINFPGAPIAATEGIDIYIWCDNDDGKIRADI